MMTTVVPSETHLFLVNKIARFVALGMCVCLCGAAPATPPSDVRDGLKVSANHRYLVDSATGTPVFILADTAWNLGALTLEEVDIYLQNRAKHGFNSVMFALNFAPQADEKNAYGQPAYFGPEKTELNPEYFATCDAIIQQCARHGMYAIVYALWAGKTAGTMNNYTPDQLETLGRRLGKHFRGVGNVILCAGGEASPNYIEKGAVNAMGRGLKAGCDGRNLVTVHPVSEHSVAKLFGAEPWLDFSLSQAKSGNAEKNTAWDAAAQVLADWNTSPVKPTMMGEHRYESGTKEDPIIQRRSLYQCVFAGGCGYAYGHDALWQMTPHTAQPWMLKGWPPGVERWQEALNTAAVRQLAHITALLYAHPYLERIPDQSLVLDGQGTDIFTRVQATRDGTPEKNDATYLMAYLSAPRAVVLNTSVIAGQVLRIYWFDPSTGDTKVVNDHLLNSGRLTLEKNSRSADMVAVIEDAAKNYPRPD